MKPISPVAAIAALLLLAALGFGAPSKAQAGVAQSTAYIKTDCPAGPLPDENTPTALYYLSSSLETYKSNKRAAVFSFTLAHTDVEIPRCDETTVSDACCATNEAQFNRVTLQLDPARCATRKALKGLKIRLNGKIIPRSHVAVNNKAGTVTIKRLPRMVVDTARGQFGFVHSVDIIMPENTECTSTAFQGRLDAWPCAQQGCDYSAVTSVDAYLGKHRGWSARPRARYPKVNKTEEGCCVSYGTSVPSAGGDSFTNTPAMGVGPPPGAEWCDAGGLTSNANWHRQILAVGDWGADPADEELVKFQKLVAEGMAAVADDCNFERIINVGDNFYENGLLSGTAIPQGSTDFRDRFRQTWTEIYHGTYESLRNLKWYGTYGNHDIGIYNWDKDANLRTCFAPEGQTWTHAQCLNEVDCCASPLWQTTNVVNDPQWVLEPGQYAERVYSPNASPTDPPLIEFFFLDSNPFIDNYFTSKRYNPSVPGGLNEWRAVRDQTKTDFLNSIRASNAIWKIPVIHTSLASYGSHCGFNNGDNPSNKSPDYPENNPLDKADCRYFVDLRRELLNMNIELTMHGHDHNQQLVKLPAGYDGTSGSKPMYTLTTGGGCKRSSVVPGPADMQLWPRNACGGGSPCKKEMNCNMNNICATYNKKKKTWDKNRESPNVGFSSLQVSPTALLVRVFEMTLKPDGPGNAPNYQLVEVVQQLIQK